MEVRTSSGNNYSYLPRTNQIVLGESEENKIEWTFNPLNFNNRFSDVGMFIIGVTEQCNLRCRYCCYSGNYEGKRSHGALSLNNSDVGAIIDFIETYSQTETKRIAFYGGEPLLHFDFVQECFNRCRSKWGNKVSFSISTNGILLTSKIIDWLLANDIEIAISVDGGKYFHDKYRVDVAGRGSFDRIFKNLEYIYNKHTSPNVTLHVTLADVRELIDVARSWHENRLLRNLTPVMVHGLTPNFSEEVKVIEYEEVRLFYEKLIDNYQKHPDWKVLQVYLEEVISPLKERLIFDIENSFDISTCLPNNTKLYVDSKLEVGVCEKFSDKYRIGDVRSGIDWCKTYDVVRKFYNIKKERCVHCPIVRICEMCLTAIEYTPQQWDVLCHNERVYFHVILYTFCEMAELGLVN